VKSIRTLVAMLVAFLTLTAGLLWVARRLYPAGGGDARRGEAVFWGAGRCATCHPIGGEGGGVRCPDLGRDAASTFAARAGGRVAGFSAVEYLVQSLLDPEAFVVPGYPARLMPAAVDPPIALGDDDVVALAAFLLADGGADRAGAGVAARTRQAISRFRTPSTAARSAPAAPGDPTRGRMVWDRMKCGVCHAVAGISSPEEAAAARSRGPELSGIGAVQAEAYLEEAVWDPNAVVVPGPAVGSSWLSQDGHTSRMPSYRESMTREELHDLVAFLTLLR
jgi:cytochrome c2